MHIEHKTFPFQRVSLVGICNSRSDQDGRRLQLLQQQCVGGKVNEGSHHELDVFTVVAEQCIGLALRLHLPVGGQAAQGMSGASVE